MDSLGKVVRPFAPWICVCQEFKTNPHKTLPIYYSTMLRPGQGVWHRIQEDCLE